MITWTIHDKTALNDFLNTDLGQKFLRYLEQSRPRFEAAMDINHMAMAGAIFKGYEQALEQIDKMRVVTVSRTDKSQYLETHKD